MSTDYELGKVELAVTRQEGSRVVTNTPATYSLVGLSETDLYTLGRILYNVGGKPSKPGADVASPRTRMMAVLDTIKNTLPQVHDQKVDNYYGVKFTGAISVDAVED